MSPSSSPVPFNNPHATTTSLTARWFPGVRTFRCNAIRVAGMLPVILVLGLHGLAYIAIIPGTLLPLVSLFPIVSPVFMLIFHFVFLSALANYLLLVLADPGSPPDDWKAPAPVITYRPVVPVTRARPRTMRPAGLSPTAAPSVPDSDPVLTPMLAPSPSSSSTDAQLQTQQLSSNQQNPQQQHQLTPSKLSTSTTSTPAATQRAEYVIPFKYAHLMRERTYDGFLRYCDTCRAYKPDRSHHCSICRRCILRMDHHCVFVNNCVSFYNHKFFVSFVTYAFVGCFLVAILAFPTFADIIALPSPRVISATNGQGADGGGRGETIGARLTILSIVRVAHLTFTQFSAASKLPVLLKTLVMVGYITSSAFAFALAIFVGLHFFLVSKGRTTIEMYEMTDPVRAPFVSEYNLGFSENIRRVCGPVPLCWFFPTRAFIPGDGLSYDRRPRLSAPLPIGAV